MSLVLLLDLDDTLLENDIETFLPQYLGSFSREVASYIDPDKFVNTLLAGTREMVKNRRPDCTLKETFDAVFFPALGAEAGKFEELADRFYEKVFPTLQGLTHPIPEAVHLVEKAVERGYRMAIATNPLFPLTAVQQRLAWANLPAEKYPFEVIASYETFHFTKPDPAYFMEVLARMGWPTETAVMVGDDFERDIDASHKLGLPVFWIPKRSATPPDGLEKPNAVGKLEEVLPWLDNSPIEDLRSLNETPYTMLATLRATPAVMDSFCRKLSDDAWNKNPREGEWCVTEIMCHLRDVDVEVNLPRLKKLFQEDNPFLVGEDTDPWASQRRYKLQDGRQALRQFIAARMELLDLLEAIPPEGWERPARHAIFGPTRLIELVNIITGHDRLHVRQTYEVLGVISRDASNS